MGNSAGQKTVRIRAGTGESVPPYTRPKRSEPDRFGVSRFRPALLLWLLPLAILRHVRRVPSLTP